MNGLSKGISLRGNGCIEREIWYADFPDGGLEYLGRLDDQLKVRGHRVEPGEIQAYLLECDFVMDAVVLPRQINKGTNELVAYIVTDGRDWSVKGLRKYLASNRRLI